MLQVVLQYTLGWKSKINGKNLTRFFLKRWSSSHGFDTFFKSSLVDIFVVKLKHILVCFNFQSNVILNERLLNFVFMLRNHYYFKSFSEMIPFVFQCYNVHCTINCVLQKKCKCWNTKSCLEVALHVHMLLHSIYDFGAWHFLRETWTFSKCHHQLGFSSSKCKTRKV